MFGRKSSAGNSANNLKKNLSQYGFMEMPDMNFGITDLDNMDDDDDDGALEAELLALTGESDASKAQKKPGKNIINPVELDKMIKHTLRDIPSDEDVSSGEDDPNVMAELEELEGGNSAMSAKSPAPVMTSPPTSNPTKQILEDRLQMYETAEQIAKQANDLSKARRMNRGITTLKDLLRQANAGKNVDEESIPPVVSVAVPKPPTNVPVAQQTVNDVPDTANNDSIVPPPIPPRASKYATEPEACPEKAVPSQIPQSVIVLLTSRQEEYKKAAVTAKKSGDIQTALKYVKIAKNFDSVIAEAKEGAIIDLSSIPPSPGAIPESDAVNTVPGTTQSSPRSVERGETQQSVVLKETPVPAQAQGDANVIPEPKTIMEALEQRLTRFKQAEEGAKNENNAGKVRRMGRIVKQYEDAIRLHKAGKPIPVEELPTPPGFAPIPVGIVSNTVAVTTPTPPQRPEVISPKVPENTPATSPASVTGSGGHSAAAVSRSVKQFQLLQERQKQFKVAALKAKQAGRLDKAKEYLRISMSFGSMIETVQNGTPIDLSSLPPAPKEEEYVETEYEVVRLNDCIEGTELDVYHKLINDLKDQVEMCIKMRDHYKAVGDIANSNKLEQLGVRTKKDLKFVQLAENNNLRLPKFHYETKPFTILQCNTDLTDNDVQVTLVQGINYNVPNPKEVDTYVKVYFPYPTETPQQYKSSTIYNTNNPSYNVATIFNIQRNVRACQRIFKRQNLKCEIWSKGGFFHSDSLIGTVNVKLQPLETLCTVHDAYDLMDGRRTVGGKLEVKLRIRDPILQKQVEHVEEKWLIIDS